MHTQAHSTPDEIILTPALTIARFSPGPFETNCYVVRETSSNACWIVDLGFEPEGLINYVRESVGSPQAIILTHTHADHIAGVSTGKRSFAKTPVWVHEAEGDWMTDARKNLSYRLGNPIELAPADRLLREGDELSLGQSRVRVLHTPGHSPGSLTLYCEQELIAFSGDALFAGSIGRTDFPGCSFEVLASSIREKLYTLPGKTRILPGHGPSTTIAREREGNPFVRAS